MVPISTPLHRLAILVLCFLLSACSRAPNPTPAPTTDTTPHTTAVLATQTPVRVEVPVTVEVTRVVTQPVIVEATPVPPRACAQAQFEATGEITIGSLLPLSGPSAFSAGFAMQTALNLAVEQIQRNGALGTGELGAATLRLITYDTAGRAERAAEFAHRLITLDCAAVLIGGYHSPVAHATAELAETYSVPYLVLHAASDELTAAQHRAVFRLAPTFSMYAHMPVALVRRLAQHQNSPIQDVLFIADPITVSAALSTRFLDELSAAGIDGELLTVDLPTQDFSPTIARILSRPSLPDVVFIYINGEAALRLQAQLLRAGIGPARNVQIVSSQVARDADAFWREIPTGAGTIVSHMGPWPGDIAPIGQEFVELYSHYSEGWPHAFVFSAYDAVFLFIDAAIRAPSLHGPDLIDALMDTDAELTAGRYRFAYGAHNPPLASDIPAYAWQQWFHPPLYYLRYTEPGQPFASMHVEWAASQPESD